MTQLNLARWIDSTEVEGPGKRFSLWVQGCRQRCPGCCNPLLFDETPRQLVDSADVVAKIAEAQRAQGIEGVTFLGGEPLLQAEALAEVAEASRQLGLSVVVFTGYVREQIPALGLPGTERLLAACDLLVDGPYLEKQPERRRNWVGSTNQRFHYLTGRYGPDIETDPRFARGFEIRLSPDGQVLLNGWPAGIPL